VTTVEEQAGRAVDERQLCRALQDGFEQRLGIRLVEASLTPEEETLKRELMEKKYSSESWNVEGINSWMSGY